VQFLEQFGQRGWWIDVMCFQVLSGEGYRVAQPRSCRGIVDAAAVSEPERSAGASSDNDDASRARSARSRAARAFVGTYSSTLTKIRCVQAFDKGMT
jgi:plasmid replication initiation protein